LALLTLLVNVLSWAGIAAFIFWLVISSTSTRGYPIEPPGPPGTTPLTHEQQEKLAREEEAERQRAYEEAATRWERWVYITQHSEMGRENDCYMIWGEPCEEHVEPMPPLKRLIQENQERWQRWQRGVASWQELIDRGNRANRPNRALPPPTPIKPMPILHPGDVIIPHFEPGSTTLSNQHFEPGSTTLSYQPYPE